MSLNASDAPTQWFSPAQRQAGRDVAEISLRLRDSTRAGGKPEDDTLEGSDPQPNPGPAPRMLWVDGVGGYLVTLADEMVLGQHNPTDPPDVAILADVSRRHARLARQGGRYVLTPYSETRVGDRVIEGPTVLDDGARFSLGEVELTLRRPHALSASAVLSITSGHRTSPAADGLLLMAESCVLGPKPHSHIRSPKWTDEAILFRSGGGLACRSTGELTHAGIAVQQPAALRPGIRIEGQDFSLCVEEVIN